MHAWEGRDLKQARRLREGQWARLVLTLFVPCLGLACFKVPPLWPCAHRSPPVLHQAAGNFGFFLVRIVQTRGQALDPFPLFTRKEREREREKGLQNERNIGIEGRERDVGQRTFQVQAYMTVPSKILVGLSGCKMKCTSFACEDEA